MGVSVQGCSGMSLGNLGLEVARRLGVPHTSSASLPSTSPEEVGVVLEVAAASLLSISQDLTMEIKKWRWKSWSPGRMCCGGPLERTPRLSEGSAKLPWEEGIVRGVRWEPGISWT